MDHRRSTDHHSPTSWCAMPPCHDLSDVSRGGGRLCTTAMFLGVLLTSSARPQCRQDWQYWPASADLPYGYFGRWNIWPDFSASDSAVFSADIVRYTNLLTYLLTYLITAAGLMVASRWGARLMIARSLVQLPVRLPSSGYYLDGRLSVDRWTISA